MLQKTDITKNFRRANSQSSGLAGCAFFYYFTIKILDYQIETLTKKYCYFTI